MLNLNLHDLLLRVIVFLLAISVHEAAHAVTAYGLGDRTAEREGRLTLNPLRHVDWLGFFMILFGPFGWARPVSVNPASFRVNRRLGMILVSAMGPLSNLFLAGVAAVLYRMLGGTGWSDVLMMMITINIALFVFNMLPLYPLDGEKILRSLFPPRFLGFFYKMETYGPFLLLLILFIPFLQNIILWPPMMGLLRFFLV